MKLSRRRKQPLFRQFCAVFLPLTGMSLLTGCASVFPRVTSTPTPTMEYCAWTWAYGDGSTAFDTAVIKDLAAQGVQGLVRSSTFGENNSCDNSFAVMSLDVHVEIQVDQLSNEVLLQETADMLSSSAQTHLAISEAPNLGNISLTFSDETGQLCYWDLDSRTCRK